MTGILLKLLGTRADDAVGISDARLTFQGGLSGGWFFLGLLAVAVLAWAMYRTTPASVSRLRKYALSVLRVIFLGMILLLTLRPVLALTVEGSIRRLVVLLLDTSASMQIKDPRLELNDKRRAAIGKNLLDPQKGFSQSLDRNEAKEVEQIGRTDLLKGVLKNPRLNLLPRLEKEFDLDPFVFGQGLVELPRIKAAATNALDAAEVSAKKVSIEQYTWIDGLEPNGPVTAIGDALREVINRKRGQPLGGIVLVTDGVNNSGSQPREAAALLRQEGVPLYTYGIGITSPRDIIVSHLLAPDVSFVQDDVPVAVRVRAQSVSGQTGRLTLKLNGRLVAEKEVTFASDGEQVVPMKFTPEAPGEFQLEAAIEPRPDEAVQDNNSRAQQLKIIDTKIKALLVDQSPRWEFRYLQAMLLRDRRVDLKCYLVEGAPTISRGTNSPYIEQFPTRKDELFKYDLVIFGDVDPRRLSAAQMENVAELVSKFGGAFVMVAGKRFTPNAYRRTPIEKVLPVEFDAPLLESTADVVADKPIQLQLTSGGRANSMLRLSDKDEENVAIWKQLPPVFWVAKVSRAKPAAEVLLVDPDPLKETRFGKMPVIALQQYGLGQALYVGTDNTWRWRKNAGDLYYTTLWGQIAQRVSLQRLLGGSKRTQLTTEKQNYTTGERISVYARLYSVGYEPVQEPAIKGAYGLRTSDGQRFEVTLRPIPEQPGLYRGEFVAPAPGSYQFFVEPDPETPLDFNVTEPKFELGETAMNEGLLKEMANITGGAFFREETLYKLPETISAKTEKVRSPLEVELWASPLAFILMLMVITAEWILRKVCYLK
jgi:hypothetical protein